MNKIGKKLKKIHRGYQISLLFLVRIQCCEPNFNSLGDIAWFIGIEASDLQIWVLQKSWEHGFQIPKYDRNPWDKLIWGNMTENARLRVLLLSLTVSFRWVSTSAVVTTATHASLSSNRTVLAKPQSPLWMGSIGFDLFSRCVTSRICGEDVPRATRLAAPQLLMQPMCAAKMEQKMHRIQQSCWNYMKLCGFLSLSSSADSQILGAVTQQLCHHHHCKARKRWSARTRTSTSSLWALLVVFSSWDNPPTKITTWNFRRTASKALEFSSARNRPRHSCISIAGRLSIVVTYCHLGSLEKWCTIVQSQKESKRSYCLIQ